MVYEKSDRWLYRPVGYESDLWWNRSIRDRINKTENKIRQSISKDLTNTGARSVSISHHSNGKNSCDYYYSRAENAGTDKNKTVTEKHCRIVDDGTMPYWWKNRIFDDHWSSLRIPSLIRAHQLSIKPW